MNRQNQHSYDKRVLEIKTSKQQSSGCSLEEAPYFFCDIDDDDKRLGDASGMG